MRILRGKSIAAFKLFEWLIQRGLETFAGVARSKTSLILGPNTSPSSGSKDDKLLCHINRLQTFNTGR
jgi:hypothetical protein